MTVVKWRLLTVGGLVTLVGSVLWKARSSPWVQANVPFVSAALGPWTLLFQAMVLGGAATVAVALFFGKWLWALAFGVLFALGAYFYAFVL